MHTYSICKCYMYYLILCLCILTAISVLLYSANHPNFCSSSSLICPYAAPENKFPLGGQKKHLWIWISAVCTGSWDNIFHSFLLFWAFSVYYSFVYCPSFIIIFCSVQFSTAHSFKYLNTFLFRPIPFPEKYSLDYATVHFLCLLSHPGTLCTLLHHNR